jgi:4-hydroxy 2-oxovalerate aldolase
MKKIKLKKNNYPIIIDCTLRDGGYYNDWDFPTKIVEDYLIAMSETNINFVEIGFRFLNNNGYKGPYAFSTDKFVKNLKIPNNLKLGLMVNASDLYTDIGWKKAIVKLFPEPANNTPIKLIRLACHFHEIPNALLATKWLSQRGYLVGLNLMQITDRSKKEIIHFSKSVSGSPVEVVYFADSMGSMKKQNIPPLVNLIRKHWKGNIGIHTHDNMGLALANTLEAYSIGVNWLDATVTGMGRGPGNTKTEELIVELNELNSNQINIIPLLELIRNYFEPLKKEKKWGTNPYYYLSGKYGIHPTFIQVMLNDSRYNENDILGAINYLKKNGGKKFKHDNLNIASQFYSEKFTGKWSPKSLFNNREVLILGSGPSIDLHKKSLEDFIKEKKPIVLALNLKEGIDRSLINFYIACHPIKLLSDIESHSVLPQPLITPASTTPKSVLKKLGNKKILDYGIKISPGKFKFYKNYCFIPNSLVISYALAMCSSGNVSKIFLAGFDGYEAGDVRNDEVENIFNIFYKLGIKRKILSITPTTYKNLLAESLYGL